MKNIIHQKIGFLFIPACLLATATAFGQSGECREDTDCAEGQRCEKGMFVDGCQPTADGSTEHCNTEPQVAETGSCVTPPPSCDTDADCGEYLSCVSIEEGGCAVDSDGNGYCPEPDPNGPKTCVVAALSCDSDDECPREYECVALSLCPAIDCAEDDADCNADCSPADQKECQPKQIACEDNADCPSEWSCQGNYIESCSGGGADSSGATEPADAADAAESEPAADDAICTQEPAVGSCFPNAWGGGAIAYDTAGPTGGEEDGVGSTSDPGSNGESASAGGGCSVARGTTRPDATWALGLLFALPLLRRRRALV